MEESLIKLLIFGGLILFSIIVSAIKEKTKKKDAGDYPYPMPPQSEPSLATEDSPFWQEEKPQTPVAQPFQQQSFQRQPSPILVGKRHQQQPASKYTPLAIVQAAAKAKAPAAPSPILSTDEGQRVTKAPAMAPVQSQPPREPIIKNKDDLRRAIILGEVLAPKF